MNSSKISAPPGLAALAVIAMLLAHGCALTPRYQERRSRLIPADRAVHSQPSINARSTTPTMMPPTTKPVLVPVSVGKASWYGPGFSGKKTASGDIFDESRLTAAHRTLPLGTKAKVTNLENGKSVKVEINDRGPYAGNRIIDLSRAAAHAIGMVDDGVVQVRVDPLPRDQAD
jgi:rare lipoprotein A